MCFLKNILKIFDIFVKMRYHITRDAEVSELADEQDSGSCERYARAENGAAAGWKAEHQRTDRSESGSQQYPY